VPNKHEGMGDVILCGCGCGTPLTSFDAWKRPRGYILGHNVRAALRAFSKQDCKPTVDVTCENTVEVQTR
jgi:hypothetical protein